MRIIGLCGRAGAGKTTVGGIVESHFPNVRVISTGDMIRQLLRERGLDETHENLQAVNQEIVETRGDDYISFIFDFLDDRHPFALIDSFRRLADVVCIAKRFENPMVVHVAATEEMRLARLLKRSRTADPYDVKSFQDLKKREDLWGVDDLCRQATVEVANVDSIADLRREVLVKFSAALSGH